MRKTVILSMLIAVVALSGCIGGKVQQSDAAGYGLEITDFSSTLTEVFSGKMATIQMSVENKGEYTVNKNYGLALLITSSDWNLPAGSLPAKNYTKDLKPADEATGAPAGTSLFRWSLTAPTIAKGQERTDTLIGRLYYDYQTRSSGNVWIYPEVEATAARDKGEGLEASSFTSTKGPIALDVSVVPDPVIAASSGELFSLLIDIKNTGDGFAYRTKTVTSSDYSIDENELNKINLTITLPAGITIAPGSEDCYKDAELIGGETSIVCDLSVTNAPSTKKIFPIKVIADYGYYTEESIGVKVVGK